MKVNELKYLRRYNLGNYEHEEITIGVAIDEGENPSDTLANMMKFVSTRGIAPMEGKSEAAVTLEKKETKLEVAKVEAAKVEVAKAEPVAPAPAKLAPKKATKLAAVPKTEAPKEEAQKKYKPSATKYDRGNETHKKLLGDLLDKNFPSWRQKPEKAKAASAELQGTDFLDGDGIVLESFRLLLKERMA